MSSEDDNDDDRPTPIPNAPNDPEQRAERSPLVQPQEPVPSEGQPRVPHGDGEILEPKDIKPPAVKPPPTAEQGDR